MLYRVAAALVLCLLTLAALPRPCAACSCATATSSGAYEPADHVFRGRVVEIEARDGDPTGATRARLEIDTVWKGQVVSEVLVQGGSGCLVYWQEEATYIVFARASNSGALRTSPCDGTGLVNARHELVTAYGAGTPVVDSAPAHDTVVNREPLRPYPVQSTETPDWTLPWAGLIVAIIGVPAAIAVVSRRRYR